MSTLYQPTFICPFCEKDIPVTVTSETLGQMGTCGCEGSRADWETTHRAAMERRKQARGRRRA